MGSMFMQKISNTKLLPVITTLLILLLVAKLIALVVWWFLPTEGVELNAKKSYQAKYQRVDFKNMLIRAKVDAPTAVSKTTTSAYSINSLVLKGLYGSKYHGFAIVAKKSAPKQTTIVGVGESYAGYKLKEIALTQVIFTKAGKEYVLALPKDTKNNYAKTVQRVNQSTDTTALSEKRVSRQDIRHYSKNPTQIWREIAIAPVMKNGKIDGFQVNRIKAGSKMAELGLQRGDVIIRANNIRLSSFNDAMKLYENINNIDTIALVVRRNNQEKELIYEIH